MQRDDVLPTAALDTRFNGWMQLSSLHWKRVCLSWASAADLLHAQAEGGYMRSMAAGWVNLFEPSNFVERRLTEPCLPVPIMAHSQSTFSTLSAGNEPRNKKAKCVTAHRADVSIILRKNDLIHVL